MNLGILVSNKKVSIIKEDGSLKNLAIDGRRDRNSLLEYIELDFLPKGSKCIVVFCLDVNQDSISSFLYALSNRLGQMRIYNANTYDVAFCGCYSVPNSKQVCISTSLESDLVFTFDISEKPHTSIIYCQRYGYVVDDTSNNSFVQSHYDGNDFFHEKNYIQSLRNDVIAVQMSEIIKSLKDKRNKNMCEESIIAFSDDCSKSFDLIRRVEKQVKIPMVTINIDFATLRQYLGEVVRNRDAFDYIVRNSLQI